MYKVGDSVELLRSNSMYHTIGDIGTIEKVNLLYGDQDCFNINCNGWRRYYSLDEIRPVNYKATFKDFNEIAQFHIKENLAFQTFKTLDEDLLFRDNALYVGCQKIEPKDALDIADHIYKAYGHLR